MGVLLVTITLLALRYAGRFHCCERNQYFSAADCVKQSAGNLISVKYAVTITGMTVDTNKASDALQLVQLPTWFPAPGNIVMQSMNHRTKPHTLHSRSLTVTGKTGK